MENPGSDTGGSSVMARAFLWLAILLAAVTAHLLWCG
jgi:hypothetical protein